MLDMPTSLTQRLIGGQTMISDVCASVQVSSMRLWLRTGSDERGC